MDCIFCKIVAKEIEAKLVFEDEEIIAFNDISPIAPVHVLIIPKKHLASINDMEAADKKLLGGMIFAAKEIAQKLGIADDGYKLLFRTGAHGGQEVAHIHLHLLGGAQLSEEIKPLT
jgi:histidine triad (HIT) family protein